MAKRQVLMPTGCHSLGAVELTAESSTMFTNRDSDRQRSGWHNVLLNLPPRTWIKSHFWHQCRRRSGGGRTMLLVWSRQLGPQQRVKSAGTHQLSEAVKSHVLKRETLYTWWSLVVSFYCRDRSTSTETGAAVPGTPKLLRLFHDLLLLSETPNNHPEYRAPGPRFNIKMSSYQYRKFHCGDKTVVRSFYLHNGISYTGKIASFYWISPLDF